MVLQSETKNRFLVTCSFLLTSCSSQGFRASDRHHFLKQTSYY
uniref:Uncharacterized protein n=1 Tax=Arundo donax TaxID=35708 RepID=A0A0A8ZHZ9_ARUDO